MKLALTIIGAGLMASTANIGSEAIHLENWRTGFLPSFKQTEISYVAAVPDTPDAGPNSALVKVVLNPVPSDVIEASLAELRQPEGPPPPPGDVPTESLCETLASAAQAYGLPAGFFARLIWQESKFQQRVVSPAGAQGVAQFMPAVAAERGLRNPFDALDALPHSARFLKEHLDYFGNLGLAAAAYNGGARRVMDWLARRGKLPQETRDYVKIITGHPPERWTEENPIELAVNLPSRAPCEGVADLSRDAEPAKIPVQLEAPVAKIVTAARVAAAKAAAEAKARLAASKAKRGKLLAKGRGGLQKPGKPLPKLAERAPTDRSARAGRTRLAAAKR